MRLLTALALVIAVCACGPGPTPPAPAIVPDPTGVAMSDFSLEDRNPASATFGQSVSVRAQLDSISAWYFSHVS